MPQSWPRHQTAATVLHTIGPAVPKPRALPLAARPPHGLDARQMQPARAPVALTPAWFIGAILIGVLAGGVVPLLLLGR